MPIVRNDPNRKSFTSIPNESIRDEALSLAARGLHHLLLSYPANWQVNVKHLAGICKEGRDKIYKLLKELERHGYILRTQERIGGKFNQIVLTVYSSPLTEKPDTAKPDTAEPDTENPDAYKRTNKQTNECKKELFKGEQKKSDTSKEYFDGTADARNIQTFPHGVPSPSPESETNGKDSNADQKDICSAQSVKKPKWSRSLDGLRGNSSRQYQQAMAEKAALTLFNNDQEEQSFYQWAKQNLGNEGERQADISISRLRNKVKATPRDKELLEKFRKTTSGPQKAPQQTRESRMASVAEKYKTDPSILKKDATAFHREYGVSLSNFKGYLFEVGVL